MSMFPTGWQVEPLSEVCNEIVDCLNKTATVVDGPTPYKMIRTTNVKDGRVNLEETRFVDEVVYRKWTRRFKPRRGDVILTREAPLGEVGLLRSDEQVFLGQRTMAYRANPEKLDQRFLYYSLLGPTLQAQIRMYGAGSTVEHMRVPQAESLQIPFPEVATQQKIAAILSAYDDLIANNQRRITLLERMAEDIYREWFVRLRFPGHQQVKIEKGVPQGWEVIELGKVCAALKRGVAPNYSETQAALVINQRCIRDGFVDLAEARGHDTKVPAEKFVRYGDVLINSTGVGTLGRVAVFDHEVSNATCDTHVTICRAKSEAVDIYFLGYALRSLQSHFESMAVGSTGQSELGRDAISRTTILRPPMTTQMNFASAVEPLLRKKRLLRRQTEALATTRDALLPRLISGKLTVDGLDIRFPPGMSATD